MGKYCPPYRTKPEYPVIHAAEAGMHTAKAAGQRKLAITLYCKIHYTLTTKAWDAASHPRYQQTMKSKPQIVWKIPTYNGLNPRSGSWTEKSSQQVDKERVWKTNSCCPTRAKAQSKPWTKVEAAQMDEIPLVNIAHTMVTLGIWHAHYQEEWEGRLAEIQSMIVIECKVGSCSIRWRRFPVTSVSLLLAFDSLLTCTWWSRAEGVYSAYRELE